MPISRSNFFGCLRNFNRKYLVKEMRLFIRNLAVAAAALAVGVAQAVQPLQGRDINGNAVDAYAPSAVMEYDPNLNVTWLRDWGSFAYATDLLTAKSWATSLEVGLFTGWELPSNFNVDGSGVCGGFGCVNTPLGHLILVELNTTSGPTTNVGPFQNVRFDSYWNSTVIATVSNYYQFTTSFRFGYVAQLNGKESNRAFAVALRQGDVVAVVPEPQTLAMMLMGLGAMAVVSRRRPH